MKKSYVTMAGMGSTAVVVSMTSMEAALDALDYATSTADWAVAYQFQGDKCVTLDHYERPMKVVNDVRAAA